MLPHKPAALRIQDEKSLFVELGPDAKTGAKSQQAYSLAAVARLLTAADNVSR